MVHRDFPWLEGKSLSISGSHGNRLRPLQKDTGSAMAKHSGAHLDLSAFSSPEVGVASLVVVVHPCVSLNTPNW